MPRFKIIRKSGKESCPECGFMLPRHSTSCPLDGIPVKGSPGTRLVCADCGSDTDLVVSASGVGCLYCERLRKFNSSIT